MLHQQSDIFGGRIGLILEFVEASRHVCPTIVEDVAECEAKTAADQFAPLGKTYRILE